MAGFHEGAAGVLMASGEGGWSEMMVEMVRRLGKNEREDGLG